MKACVALGLMAILASVGFSTGDNEIRKEKRLISELFNFVGELLTFALDVLEGGIYIVVDLTKVVLTLPLAFAEAAVAAALDFTKSLLVGCRLTNMVSNALGDDRYEVTMNLEKTKCPYTAENALKDPTLCPKVPGGDIVCRVTMRKGGLFNLYKPVVESKICTQG